MKYTWREVRSEVKEWARGKTKQVYYILLCNIYIYIQHVSVCYIFSDISFISALFKKINYLLYCSTFLGSCQCLFSVSLILIPLAAATLQFLHSPLISFHLISSMEHNLVRNSKNDTSQSYMERNTEKRWTLLVFLHFMRHIKLVHMKIKWDIIIFCNGHSLGSVGQNESNAFFSLLWNIMVTLL